MSPVRVCAQLKKFEEGETYAEGSSARATCPHLNLSSGMENAICCSLLTCSNGTHCGLFLSCQVLRRENVWFHSTRDLCRVPPCTARMRRRLDMRSACALAPADASGGSYGGGENGKSRQCRTRVSAHFTATLVHTVTGFALWAI